MRRTLTLKKDTLTELGSADLASVVGGSAGTCYTCVQLNCIVDDVKRITTILGTDLPPLPSIDNPCS